jgi:hypothetical protein
MTVWNLDKKPSLDIEVRLVIWDTKDVVMADWEGTSDVYIRSFFESRDEAKETDTHFRC